MIPRGRPDIGWCDLLAGFAACLVSGTEADWNQCAAGEFSNGSPALVTLSVRSGLDLLCRVMQWPAGSEVVMSAVTLEDMAAILREHQLVPVPIDVDPVTLTVDPQDLERHVTERTKAVLVAHLFGSRMPLDEIARIAGSRGLMLIEDCAQAYTGDPFRGHPAADVSLFSFGPIKTHTALGGAVLRFRDHQLREQIDRLQQSDPPQARLELVRRLLMFSLLKVLSLRPSYSAFVAGCAMLGVDHEGVISNSVRGFPPGQVCLRIRRRPCMPMVRLLARRLRAGNTGTVARRIEFARRVIARLPPSIAVGAGAVDHTHWVLPIRSHDPEGLVKRLQQAGFDATRGASRLCAVPRATDGTAPPAAAALIEQIVYLPMWPAMSEPEIDRLVTAIGDHTQQGSPAR